MYQQLSDDALMQLLRDSDMAAFAEIYRRYWERMTMHVLKVIGSKEDARDIVQEVFVSVWRRREEIELRSSLAGYLLRSVRNISIRHIERNITRHQYLQTLSLAAEWDRTDPGQCYEAKELQEQIERAVAGLPAKMQEVYILSRREKMSYKEIAEHLGIAENTVKKQLSNALKTLRRSVKELAISVYFFLNMHFF